MPPQIVLAACTAFVFFLLKLDHKQAPDLGWTTWIPTVWLLVTSTRPLGAWFQVEWTDPTRTSNLDLIYLIVLFITALIILVGRRFHWGGAVRENEWLILLLFFMLLSVFWSDLPGSTFNRWLKELLAILMAFLVLSEPFPRRTMESILRRTTYIFIPYSLVLIKYFPEYGRFYTRWAGAEMWTGVATHKNSLTRICIISGFFLIWSLVKRKQGKNPAAWKYQTHAEVVLILLSLYLFMGPNRSLFHSATSFYALAAGLLVYSGFLFTKKRNIRLPAGLVTAMVGFIMVYGVIAFFTAGSKLGSFASTAGRDASLTGRTGVWSALVPQVNRRPLTGGGFGVFWTPERRDFYLISGAHNGYLDVILGLGFIGLGLVFAFILASSLKASKEVARDFDWGVLWTIYIIMLVVYNMGETSIDSFTTHLTAVVVIMTVISADILRHGKGTGANPDA